VVSGGYGPAKHKLTLTMVGVDKHMQNIGVVNKGMSGEKASKGENDWGKGLQE